MTATVSAAVQPANQRRALAGPHIALAAIDHMAPLVGFASLPRAWKALVDRGVGQPLPGTQRVLHQQRRRTDGGDRKAELGGNELGRGPCPAEWAGLQDDVEPLGQDRPQEAAGCARLLNPFGRQRRIETPLLATGLVPDRLAMTDEVDQDAVATRRPVSVSLQTSQSGFSGLLNQGSAQPRARHRRTMAAATA